MYRRGGGRREVSVVDVAVDELELVLYLLERVANRPACVRVAAVELEIGDQTPEPEHRRRGAGLGVGGLERVVKRLDRGGHRARVGAVVEQETRHRTNR